MILRRHPINGKPYMNYSLNFFKGGYKEHYIGERYRGYEWGYEEFGLEITDFHVQPPGSVLCFSPDLEKVPASLQLIFQILYLGLE